MSRRSDRIKRAKRAQEPPRPSAEPRVPPSTGDGGKVDSSSAVVRISLGVLNVVTEWLKHHFEITLVLTTASVLIVFYVVYVSRSGCVNMTNTPLGSLSICPAADAPIGQSVDAEGLHGEVYVDRRAGFSLRLTNADQWSVIQPYENSDGTKTVVFPPGILGKIPVTMIVRDVSVVFISKKNSEGGASSAWVFRVSGDRAPIERFVAEETKNLRRTAPVWTTYTVAQMLNESPVEVSPEPDPHSLRQTPGDGRVHLTSVQYAPNRRDALLLWDRPQIGLPIDLLGRVVVAERDTYYVVTLKFSGQAPREHEVNAALRTLITSFRPL